MAKKKTAKETKAELLEKHGTMLFALIEIFKGQVLNMDLKEFCLNYKIYSSENKYNAAIIDLEDNNLLDKGTLINTNNSTVIAKNGVYTHFRERGETTRTKRGNSTDLIIRNTYVYKMIKGYYTFINLEESLNTEGLKRMINYIKCNTTFLSSARNPFECYSVFKQDENTYRLTTTGVKALRASIIREAKRQGGLANIKEDEDEKENSLKDIELDKFGVDVLQNFQTLREKDVYLSKASREEIFNIYMIDITSNLASDNISDKITELLNILNKQTTKVQYLNIFLTTKDYPTLQKLGLELIKKYRGGEALSITDKINRQCRREQLSIYFESKVLEDSSFILENTHAYTDNCIRRIHIKMVTVGAETKHSNNTKTQALTEHNNKIKELNIRNKFLEEMWELDMIKNEYRYEIRKYLNEVEANKKKNAKNKSNKKLTAKEIEEQSLKNIKARAIENNKAFRKNKNKNKTQQNNKPTGNQNKNKNNH